MKTSLDLVNADQYTQHLHAEFPSVSIRHLTDKDGILHIRGAPVMTIIALPPGIRDIGETGLERYLTLPARPYEGLLLLGQSWCMRILAVGVRMMVISGSDGTLMMGPLIRTRDSGEIGEIIYRTLERTPPHREGSGSHFPAGILLDILRDSISLIETSYWKERTGVTAGFVDMFSHDIGLPLTSLKANVEHLLAGDTHHPGPHMNILEAIRNDILKIDDMRREALMLNKFDSGSYTLNRKLASIFSLLQEVQVRFLPQADRKNLTFTMESPHFSAPVDIEKMRHVLDNLVSNALKYTPPGGAILVSAGKGKETFWIRVEDTGVGIPKGSEHRLFERFSRFHKNMAQGTGLGLSIVRTIAELHGGTVRYTPREGGGSIFTVELPGI